MPMLNTFAPRVVIPPWASSSAWKSSTIVDRKAITGGRNSTAPRPVPVGCDELPVTEGSLIEDSTKVKAPAAASSSRDSGCSFDCLMTARAPWTTNGVETANQATHVRQVGIPQRCA